GTGALDRMSYEWLDVQSLQSAPVVAQGNFRHTAYRDQVHVRASADGSIFGMWCLGQSPAGITTLVVRDGAAQLHYEHNSAGHICPSWNGTFLATGTGILTGEARAVDAWGK